MMVVVVQTCSQDPSCPVVVAAVRAAVAAVVVEGPVVVAAAAGVVVVLGISLLLVRLSRGEGEETGEPVVRVETAEMEVVVGEVVAVAAPSRLVHKGIFLSGVSSWSEVLTDRMVGQGQRATRDRPVVPD